MGTISDKLTYLANVKQTIKNAIINKGQTIEDTDTFASYADKINDISTTPNLQAKSQTITSNGSTSITADSDYDGLSKVTVTTNVQRALTSSNSFAYQTSYGSGTVSMSKTFSFPAGYTYGVLVVQVHQANANNPRRFKYFRYKYICNKII